MPRKKKETAASFSAEHWEKIAADTLIWVNEIRYALLEPALSELPPVIKDPKTEIFRGNPLRLCFPRITHVDDLAIFFKNKLDAGEVRQHLQIPDSEHGQITRIPLNDAARRFLDGWVGNNYPQLKLDAPPPPKPKVKPETKYIEFDTMEQAVASGLRNAVVKKPDDTAIKMPPLQIGSIFHYQKSTWRIDTMQFATPTNDRVKASATDVTNEGKSVGYVNHFYDLAHETKLPIDMSHVIPYEAPAPLKEGDTFTFQDREYRIKEVRKCFGTDREGHRVTADDLKLRGIIARVFSNFEQETGLTVVEPEPEPAPEPEPEPAPAPKPSPVNDRILVVSPKPANPTDSAAIEQRNQDIGDAIVASLTETAPAPAAPTEDEDYEEVDELAPVARRDQSLLHDFLDYVTSSMEIDWSEIADLVTHDLDNPAMPAPWREAGGHFLDWCEEHLEEYVEDEEDE